MNHSSMHFGSISTSEIELKDLLKAWIAISLAFAIAIDGFSFSSKFYLNFIIASLTVGTGFLLHELGHKIVAQKYNCFAEFRSFDNMLLLAIAMSFLGFIFAAPGAVMISGKINLRKNGIISIAGPIVNLVLASGFYIMLLFNPEGVLGKMGSFGFSVNSWLALFNMIPFGLFDGYKIFRWDKRAYFAVVTIAAVFVFLL
ncbi:MAG TPA: metalloprotease [Candidatus Nanoarchaeia archaeon]|nr:metalloprotease [Candidatus Nanoarchaeia archaeon]